MADETNNLILRQKKSSFVWLLLVCSVFVGIGFWMVKADKPMGYLCIAFFGLGIPVGIIQLFPGSSYLQINPDGFTFCSLFRKTFIPWSVIDEFFVVHLRQTGVKVHEMVGFNFVPSYDKAQFGRKISKVMGECEGSLPDTYGKKTEELAEFMNQCLLEAIEVEQNDQMNES